MDQNGGRYDWYDLKDQEGMLLAVPVGPCMHPRLPFNYFDSMHLIPVSYEVLRAQHNLIPFHRLLTI